MCKKVCKINIQEYSGLFTMAGVFTMAGGDSEQLINFCISLFASFEATMAFVLECCTAFSKSVE